MRVRSKERDSCKEPYVSNLGHLFQTEIPTGHKLSGELAVYIYMCIYHAYTSDHVGFAQSQLHCKLVRGETQDKQLMNHLKFQ